MTTCIACRYFRAGVSSISPVRYKEGLGECRRYAPRGPVHMTWSHGDGDKEMHVASMTPFPIVPADDWCGDHSPKSR
jgi:hypothetical protein